MDDYALDHRGYYKRTRKGAIVRPLAFEGGEVYIDRPELVELRAQWRRSNSTTDRFPDYRR